MAWPNSQTRRVELVVQNAQVSGSGTHSDFPVLITRDNLPDEMCSPTDGNRAQSDGGDIRAASSDDGTGQIPIEIVKFEYDSADGAGDAAIQIWVKRDLNTASDTSIWLAYNTSGTTSADAVGDPFGRNAVWSDYAIVQHLEATGSQTDSTGNGHTLTENGNPAAVGGLSGLGGNAIDFDGSGDFYDASTDPRGDSSFTAQFLLQTAGGAAETRWIVDDGDGTSGGFQALLLTDGTLRTRIDDSGDNNVSIDTTTAVDDSASRLFHLVADKAGNAQQYLNGSADGASADISSFGSIAPTANLIVGTAVGLSGTREYDGILDELRIRESVLSTDWLATEWNMMNSPATFIVEGAAEDVGAAAAAVGAGLTTGLKLERRRLVG